MRKKQSDVYPKSTTQTLNSFVDKKRKQKKMKKYLTNNVDAYIAKCPKEVQDELRKIRSAIQAAAPDAIERADYF